MRESFLTEENKKEFRTSQAEATPNNCAVADELAQVGQEVKKILDPERKISGLNPEKKLLLGAEMKKIVLKNLDQGRQFSTKIIQRYQELGGTILTAEKIKSIIKNRDLLECRVGIIAQTEILQQWIFDLDLKLLQAIKEVCEDSDSMVYFPLKDRGWSFVNSETAALIVRYYRDYKIFPKEFYKFESDPVKFQEKITNWMKDHLSEWHYLFFTNAPLSIFFASNYKKAEQRYGLWNGFGDSALFYSETTQLISNLLRKSDSRFHLLFKSVIHPYELEVSLFAKIDENDPDVCFLIKTLQEIFQGKIPKQITEEEKKMILAFIDPADVKVEALDSLFFRIPFTVKFILKKLFYTWKIKLPLVPMISEKNPQWLSLQKVLEDLEHGRVNPQITPEEKQTILYYLQPSRLREDASPKYDFKEFFEKFIPYLLKEATGQVKFILQTFLCPWELGFFFVNFVDGQNSLWNIFQHILDSMVQGLISPRITKSEKEMILYYLQANDFFENDSESFSSQVDFMEFYYEFLPELLGKVDPKIRPFFQSFLCPGELNLMFLTQKKVDLPQWTLLKKALAAMENGLISPKITGREKKMILNYLESNYDSVLDAEEFLKEGEFKKELRRLFE